MLLSSNQISEDSGNKARGDEQELAGEDGAWARKRNKHFGYRLHDNVDAQYGLIRAIETITA